jgi:hypothetical protein
MTFEEMERAMAFVLEQQAHLTATMASIAEQQVKTGVTVGRLSETVDRLSAKVDRTHESVVALLAIAEIHEREIEGLKDGQVETRERLNALINAVERYVSGGGGQDASG